MLLGYEKIDFLHLPTPVERLDNISRDLGVEFYIKRDDLTPLAAGGNKLRKLEYFLKDAKDKGATFLLTVGGAQTNHGRLTLAVARKYGMKGAIVAVDKYPGELSANLLLDGMMGCDVWLKDPKDPKFRGLTEDEMLDMVVPDIIKHYEELGEKVYYIPMGGSNELGILGYYECALELTSQIRELGLDKKQGTKKDGKIRVIDTVGSMGTYMGLQMAVINENLPLHITGIGIMPYDEEAAKAGDIEKSTHAIRSYAVDYFKRVCRFYNLKKDGELLSDGVTEDDFDLRTEYDRGAYNNPVKEVREAMYYMAEKEAIIPDPCYTGKCFAGILEMIKSGEIAQGETVVMIHTGGFPGINTPFHRIEIEHEREHFVHVI